MTSFFQIQKEGTWKKLCLNRIIHSIQKCSRKTDQLRIDQSLARYGRFADSNLIKNCEGYTCLFHPFALWSCGSEMEDVSVVFSSAGVGNSSGLSVSDQLKCSAWWNINLKGQVEGWEIYWMQSYDEGWSYDDTLVPYTMGCIICSEQVSSYYSMY